jgi:thiamine pyrophosphokinase
MMFTQSIMQPLIVAHLISIFLSSYIWKLITSQWHVISFYPSLPFQYYSIITPNSYYFLSRAQPHTLIVVGAFGGRFDQEISSIHALYKWQSSVDRMVLVGGENVAILLSPGTHSIIPVKSVEGPTCGLLPLGGKVHSITTSGLQWDLQGQSLEFGGLVSSSNCIRDDADEVLIETSDYVIWTNIINLT